MSTNAVLADRAVDLAIDRLRYARGVAFRMIAILNRSDARLMAELTEALMRLERDAFTVERLESLLASLRAVNAQAYRAVMDALQGDLQALAEAEANAGLASWRNAVPSAVQIRFPIAGVSAEQVYAAALSRPFQGRLLRDWAAGLEQARLTLVRNAVRSGFVEGRTSAEIITQLRGTRALKFADGLLQRSRRELATVVQTALSHTAQMARQALTDANADLVKATQWVSTLDDRTSSLCRVRDGLQYSADAKHRPLGHKIPWGDGPGRLHFNCRSVSVPVLKSWQELGIDADELPAGTRASMDGQVPADMTYAQWFARQPAARQDEIVGPVRGALYRAGKVRFEQFSDDKGAWLTLDELRARLH
jgi:phage tail protein X